MGKEINVWTTKYDKKNKLGLFLGDGLIFLLHLGTMSIW
jgi:hypothetical protein